MPLLKPVARAGQRAFLLALFVLCAASAVVQAREAQQPSSVPPAGFFTIGKIEPRLKDKAVSIYFTDAVDLASLKDNLKIIPAVTLSWVESVLTDPQRLVLKGDFKAGQQYALFLPTGFQSWNARSYVRGISAFLMPEYRPGIAQISDGSLIERDSRQLFPVLLTSVSDLDIRLLSVPLIMLSQAQDAVRYGSARPWTAVKKDLEASASRLAKTVRKGDFKQFFGPVAEEVRVVSVPGSATGPRPFSLSLSFRKKRDEGGVFLLHAADAKRTSVLMPLRLVAITDIGLSYKISEKGLLVWATSLRTGKPLDDVAVLAFTENSDALFLGETDKRGLLFVKNREERATLGGAGSVATTAFDPEEIRMLAAVLDEDRSFVEVRPDGNLKPAAVIQARSDEKTGASSKAMVFTDRGLYQPDDTVSVKGIVREYCNGTISPPKDGMVRFRISGPSGAELLQKELKLSDFGTAADAFLLSPLFGAGQFSVTMEHGPTLIERATTTFAVREPRPQRHAVEVSCRPESGKNKDFVNIEMQSESLLCSISSQYLSGGPMKKARVQWQAYHRKTEYPRPDHPAYSFGHPLEERTDLISSGETTLDETGRATISFGFGNAVLSGMYGVEVVATVLDIDGSSSSGSAVYQAEPAYLVGIAGGPAKAMPGDRRTLNVIVVDKKGKKVKKGLLSVRVMQQAPGPVENAGAAARERKSAWRTLLGSEVPITDGAATFAYDVPSGGDSLVSFTYQGPEGRSYGSGVLVSVPEGSGGAISKEETAPSGVLHLYPEKAVYKPGETMKVRLGASRPLVACLVTLEQAGVQEYGIMELAPGQETIDIPVKEGFGPNVYLSVLGTVARTSFPSTEQELDSSGPDFLFGTTGIEVKQDRTYLSLSINDNRKTFKTSPGAEVTIEVSIHDEENKGREAEVTLGVIREDILTAAGFSVPAVDRLGRPLMPLGVFTGEARTGIVRQSPKESPLTVSPSVETERKQVMMQDLAAVVATDAAAVAYWNPSLKTDAAGSANVTFKAPAAPAWYRIYAVACDQGARFGTAEGTLVLQKGLSLAPELPAAVTRGDWFLFSLKAANGTDKKADLLLHLPAEGLLKFSMPKSEYSLKPSESLRVPMSAQALETGLAELRFSGALPNASDVVERKLPVHTRPVAATEVLLGTFQREGTVPYDLPAGLKVLRSGTAGPDEVKAVLTISGSPLLRLSQTLRFLLDDPPGSPVQRGTAVMALASLMPDIRNGLVPGVSAAEADAFVRKGIDELLGLQAPSGGFSLKPGQPLPHRWASLASFGALAAAKQAGFDVPRDRMDKALAFVQRVARQNREADILFNAYGLYFLAVLDSLERPVFDAYAQAIDKLPPEAAMMVLAAGTIAKALPDDAVKTKLQAILKNRKPLLGATEEFSPRFREPSAALLAASLVFPRDEATEMAAGELLSGMTGEGAWPSATGTAWAVYALHAYYTATRTVLKPATIMVKQGGRLLDTFVLDPKDSRIFELDAEAFLKNPSVTLSSGLETPFLYQLAVTYPQAEYAKRGFSKGIEVQKTLRNVDGSDEVRLGDLVEVRLRFTLNVPVPRSVLVEDALPGGLALIGSAVAKEEDMLDLPAAAVGKADADDVTFSEAGADEDIWYDLYLDPAGHYRFVPEALDIAADRIRAFRNKTWSGVYEFAYYARAAFEGEFAVPAAKVRLAEDGDIHGYSPAGTLAIR